MRSTSKEVGRTMSKMAVLGSGQVGQVLADGLISIGHEVMRGSRDPNKLSSWKAGAGEKAHVGQLAEAARMGRKCHSGRQGTALPQRRREAGPVQSSRQDGDGRDQPDRRGASGERRACDSLRN